MRPGVGLEKSFSITLYKPMDGINQTLADDAIEATDEVIRF